MSVKIKKTCEWCGRTFYVRPYMEKTARFCSRSCCARWQIKFRNFGVNTRWTKERLKGNKFGQGRTPWNKGLKGIRLSPTLPPVMRGKDNPTWKPPIARKCENCGEVFYKKPWELKGSHKGRFCSPKCRDEYYIKTGHLFEITKKARKTPTSAEKRFMELCERFHLPFLFVGDGSFWIGKINPDFVWKEKKIAVEIMSRYHHNFFKLFSYGKLLPWFKTPTGRKEYLKKFGWDSIILPDNFEENKAMKEVLGYCPLQRNLLNQAY